ncbi:MAG TPA: agmatine deiminase family protein [Bryobacteraceae bacterium]|jgi:agmatine deiminase|nr:agmatine deiminase family protein [Bryobacteraceae bacterium]
MPETPRDLGYRMPAEWSPHAATWLAWPHNREDWPGKFAPIAWVYCEIVKKLARVERVRILVQNEDLEQDARRKLKKVGADLDAVQFFRQETDRVWTRDYCPLFLKGPGGEVAVTNWRFNGWAKYDDWKRDNAVPAVLARKLKLRQWSPGLVLEGGSVDVNGAGLVLTTEECLLSPVQARNPGLSRGQIEQALSEYLGADKVVWLGRGIAGDDTHGHVDDLARFVSEDTVALVSERDRSDANYEPLRENLEILRRHPLRVVKLPMPAPVVFNGQRLPASYANFYIANKLVLVPTFNDPADRIALATLARCFPDREVAGIHAADLVWGLGTLHCMTQQEPKAGVRC